MSWDKNTVNYSTLDSTKEILEELEIKYKLIVLGKVMGRGLNDDSFMGTYDKEEDRYYELRRLEYKNKVILEQISQDADCDTDDIIRSHKFNILEEPKDWKYQIETDILGNHSDWIDEENDG